MPATLTIPNGLYQAGATVYGPMTLVAADADLQVNLDRTPSQGLNARTTATTVVAVFEMLLPGDPTWYEQGRGTFSGGARVDADTGQVLAVDLIGVSLWNPGMVGRQVRCTLTVAGSSVRLAGTLVVS